VVIIDADHFDLGYHGLIADVANKYFDTFWPRAMDIQDELRAGGHAERYVYTTFSWLVSTYLHCPPNAGLHCPSAKNVARFTGAVKRGDLIWPAFPFNSEHGAYNADMAAFGVNLTHGLDDALGVPRKLRWRTATFRASRARSSRCSRGSASRRSTSRPTRRCRLRTSRRPLSGRTWTRRRGSSRRAVSCSA